MSESRFTRLIHALSFANVGNLHELKTLLQHAPRPPAESENVMTSPDFDNQVLFCIVPACPVR
jgi:hypothetical protein